MTDKPSREERLAAKLRENLKRRKSQARGMKDGEMRDREGTATDLSNPDTDS